jgi:hypothetical protein
MLTGLDHIVIAVRDLAAAASGFAGLGFVVEPGGRHPRGTHNALIGFADGTYVELLAFHEPGVDHRWWAPLQRGGGLVDYCLATDGLDADAAAFRRAGVAMEDRGAGGRTRPDGYRLAWTVAVPPRSESGVAPFLIEDVTPRRERVPRHTGHLNGVRGVGTVTVATPDPARAARAFAVATGRSAVAITRRDLDAAGYRIGVGAHAIELIAPRAGGGPVADWLARRGPSPYAATLRGPAGRQGPLDPTRAQGARLILA